MSGLARDGAAEPVSREIECSGANEDRGKCFFPGLADHKQECQPYPVDAYSAKIKCDDYINTPEYYVIYCIERTAV